MSAWSSNAKFENGQLMVAGKSAIDLAREFGTPSFILDEADFKSRAMAFRDAMNSAFPSALVYYASKAFTCKEVLR